MPSSRMGGGIDYDRMGTAVAAALDARGDTVNIAGAGTEDVIAFLQRRSRRRRLMHPVRLKP